MPVHILQQHKQAHLFGIISMTKSMNVIGNTCFNSRKRIETDSPHQSSSTEAFFSLTYVDARKLVCVLKKVSHEFQCYDQGQIEGNLKVYAS